MTTYLVCVWHRCKIKHLTHQVTVGAPGEKRGRGRSFNTSITFDAFSVEKMLASIFKMHAKQIINVVPAIILKSYALSDLLTLTVQLDIKTTFSLLYFIAKLF